MKVIDTVTQEAHEVYHIRDDKKGYPHFLIYENKQWLYKSAKYFIPVSETKTRRLINPCIRGII